MAHSQASGRPTASTTTSLPRFSGEISAHRFHRVFYLGDLHHFVRAHALGGRHLRIALHHGNDIAAGGLGHLHKHQADGPAADDGDGVADFDSGLVQSAQHASQRLDHGGFFVGNVGGNRQHVGFNNAARNANVLGVGAVVEQQVFAEIFLMLGAVEAHLAGRRVQRHHPHALLEAAHAVPDFFDHSGQFMSKERRRDNHARVIAALVDLQVGAAGQGDLHFDQYFPIAHARDGHSFNLYVLFAIEDGSCHLSVHARIPSHELPG